MLQPVSFKEKLTKNTLIQSLVLGFVAGPIAWWFLKEHTVEELVWCMVAMGIAPVVVDLIRPTYRNVQ